MRNITLLLFLITINYFVSIAQPANDACPNATLISNVNNFCSSNGAGTTVGSTDDVATTGGFAAASCWGGTVNDVWFKFVAVATDVTIVINGNQGSPVGGTLNRPQVALYSGSCSGTINELNCASAPSGQHIIQLYKGGLTIGETYLIRVDGVNANTGTFQYCINNFNPVPVPSSDCPTAVVLCDKNSFTVPSVSGAGTNTTEMDDAACFGGSGVESNSTWYVFKFATGGTFGFTLVPSNPVDDLDFVVYKLPNGIGNCAGKQVVRCMASAPCPGTTTGTSPSASYTDEYSGCNADGSYLFCAFGGRCQSQFVRELTVVAGETYAIAINNFTSTGNGFNISFTGTAQIQGPTAIINDSDADDQICPGEAITFTDASTPPPSGTLTTWTWNFGVGATPATFSGQNPPAVTYSSNGTKTVSLTVKSDKGCLVTSTKIITVASTPPTVSIVASQNPICSGTSVIFTATPTNAGAAPVYQWFLNGNPVGTNSNTYTNNTLNNNDQVRVRVTSNSSCNSGTQATSNTITMTVNASPSVAVNSPSICSGLTAALTASGATSYTWTGGLAAVANPNTPVLTTTTTYTVTGTTSGCTATAVATVTVKLNPTVSVNSPSICSAQSTTLTASGASTYSWTGGLAAVANPTTPVLTTTTTYTVTGTTNGCTGTAVATVTVNSVINVTVNSPSICSGQTATLTASGATTYTWTGGLAAISNPTTPALTTTTTYTVTGSIGTCTGTAVATVTVKPNPVVSVNSTSICNSQSASLTASGATTYSWTGGLAAVSNPTTPALTTTTTYTVTGTTNGCTSTAVSTVTVKPNPIISVNNPSICSGLSANLIAGGATNYSWTGGLAAVSNPATPILTTTTTYTVTGTTNGCTGTAVATVTVTPKPAVTVNSPSVCSGSTAGLTANGATGYSWTGGLASVSNPTTPTLTTTTTYTVTGSTAGCTNTAVATVTVNPNPSVVVNNPNICPGQTASLNASGATTYSWTGGLAAVSNPTTPALTTTTTYTVTGTTNGCTGTAVATVSINSNLIINVNSPTICSGQTASLTASGAANYTWTGGLAAVSNPSTPILTSTTTYTVTGNTSGCTGSAVATVTVTPNPVLNVNSPSICNGQTTTLNANGATTYSWTGGLSAVSNPITPVLTTTTTYTVTGTANGCTGTAVSTVTVKPNPVVSVNNPGICGGLTANLTANGATSYIWTGGLAAISNPTTPALSTTTTYTVTGTTNACTGTAVSTVTVTPQPVLSVNSPSICSGQSASLIANGATTYSWTGGLSAVSNPVTAALTTTSTYTVTGTTGICTGSATATVTVRPVKVSNITRVICQGQSVTVGTRTFTSTGNYTVVLQTSQSCDSTVNLALTVNPTKVTNISKTICQGQSVTVGSQTFTTSGNYTVVLQTSQACDSTVNLALTVNPALVPAVSISSNKNNICTGDAVVFTATASNTGVTPSYQWQLNGTNVGGNSAQYSNSTLADGDVVKVTINTTAACANPATVTSNSINMTVNSATYTKPLVEYCKGDSQVIDLGIITVPNTPYTVKWSSGGTSTTIANSNYTVKNSASANIPFEITYGNNCKVNDVLPVRVNPLPAIDATSNVPRARYEEEINLDVLSAATILSYNWTPASLVSADSIKDPVSVIRASTLFTVQVTDNHLCSNTDSVWVELIDECSNDFIHVPMAFSPNRDGINDCFAIVYPPVLSNYKMVIFDRWGEKVFETADVKGCWDGTYKGADAQSDAYVYVISFTCYNGKNLSKKGTITIVR